MKILVSYFSASGVTKEVATQLANLLHADLEEIKPIRKYIKEDLDWQNNLSRSSLEMKDENSRPQIKKTNYNLSSYDVIFIGYPIWWYVEPRIVDTYLDSFNLEGKRIIPFATSGGSSISESIKHLKRLYKNAKIEEGILLNHGINENIIRKMVEGEKQNETNGWKKWLR